jgi:lipase maturation factor 1
VFEPVDIKPPILERWLAPMRGGESYLVARWIWLRALGGIFFSAFLSLWFQIDGLIGPRGISPAGEYLQAVRRAFPGIKALWFAPTLLWIDAGSGMLQAIVVIGLLASVALILNLWPRASIVIAGIAFLSFIGASQEFGQYQSDGMLLEAAFLSLFFAPRGLRPRLGTSTPPSRASLWLLRYEWFRIYFESGVVKILSGEPQWRDFTAMDKYYENGPLPTWIGWYVQQLPHSFHAATVAYTLLAELILCWLMFFPKRSRLIVFVLTTPLQIGIILTANYAFLNYLVLFLGILLLNDVLLGGKQSAGVETDTPAAHSRFAVSRMRVVALVLSVHFLTTTLMFFDRGFPTARLVEPFRIANSYGLFAVMTRARYEIEYQGTIDGTTWIAYPFRFKPQDPKTAPGIYAPYQPRFEWNLWFASLGTWQGDPWTLNVEQRLLDGEPAVLRLFASDPFRGRKPIAIRSMLWRYWFTNRTEHRATGAWWRRELLEEYAPTLP